MKKLIKGLFKYIMILLVMIGVMLGIGYYFRNETQPLEQFVRSTVVPMIIGDTTTVIGVDSVLTPAEEFQLQIDSTNAALAKRTQVIDSLQSAFINKLDSLNSVRTDLDARQTQLSQDEKDNLDKLAKLYENMQAAQASAILLELPDQTVVEILVRMKDREAGKVIEAMDPIRAADIVRRYKSLSQIDRQQNPN